MASTSLCKTALAAFALFAAGAGTALHAQVPNAERAALQALYTATQGDGWSANGGWNGAAGSECSWYGIACDSAGAHVVAIQLPGNNLTGTLPDLTALSALQTFDVSFNRLTGALPSISALTHLSVYDVSYNDIAGPLPVLSGLTQLGVFSARDNPHLFGALPSLAGLASLQRFDVANDPLTGPIPSLAGLTNLEDFDVANCHLSGTIPSLAGLTSLRAFSASLDGLTGTLPSLAGLSNLITLDVQGNQLSGPIPDLADAPQLSWVFLSGNRLSGPIPPLGVLTQLEIFNADNNQLSGPIPALSTLTQLHFFHVQGNLLTGSTPTLTGAVALQDFDAHANRLDGTIGAFAGLQNLDLFDVSENQLQGALPAFDALPTLAKFDAHGNRLSGAIPDLHGALLYVFDVHSNALSGALPALAGMTYLETFDVHDNQLSGAIPPLTGLGALERFDVHANRLSGSIPSLRGIGYYTFYNFNDNRLTGPIPDLDGAYLGALDVGNNQLSGPVPTPPAPVSIPNEGPGYPGMAPGQSNLCPNPLTFPSADPGVDIAWNALTGTTPWWAACAGDFNLDQRGLTGSWYNPATPGQGFEFETYPDLFNRGQGLLFGGWFTYDTDAANGRRWYALQGLVDAQAQFARLDVLALEGGNFAAAPALGTGSVVGQATIEFSTCDRGVLNYAFSDGSGRNGSIPLQRLTANVQCTPSGDSGADAASALLSGNWYDASTPGQGLMFDFSASRDRVFAAWYTFKPDGAQLGGRGSEDWYTLQAQNLAPGTTTLSDIPILESSDGVFDDGSASAPRQVGSAQIVLQSCSAMTLSYRFDSGLDAGRSGTLDLVRVGPVPSGCRLP